MSTAALRRRVHRLEQARRSDHAQHQELEAMSDHELWRIGRGLYPALVGTPEDLRADAAHLRTLGPGEADLAHFVQRLSEEDRA